jgi:hypothetical protein
MDVFYLKKSPKIPKTSMTNKKSAIYINTVTCKNNVKKWSDFGD